MEVSLCIITYNQASFIEACIESVLNQKIDVESEIIIFDDASTDGTTDLCRKMAEKHPSKITLYEHSRNSGMHDNWLNCLKTAKGKFIAVCEGDDCWENEERIQKQYNLMQINPQYCISGGAAIKIDESGTELGPVQAIQDQPLEYCTEDFYTNNRLVTCTAMFRNPGFEKWPKVFRHAKVFDWLLWLFVMKNTGGIVHISPEVYGRYRVHSGGVFSSLTDLQNINGYITNLRVIRKYIGKEDKAKKIWKQELWYRTEKYRINLQQKRLLQSIKNWFTLLVVNKNIKQSVSLLREFRSAFI